MTIEKELSSFGKEIRNELNDIQDRNIYFSMMIGRLDKRIEEIEEFFHMNWKHNSRPHKCPVCEGSRFNKPELKTVDAKMSIDGVECKAADTIYWKSICNVCEGEGIVWG